MTHVISINGLSKTFGKTHALRDVSFHVPAHSIFGLLGPNGAGKTTLFSIVADFLRADRGTVNVLGVDTRNIAQLQGRLTILPQDARFQHNVPILDQLVFFQLLSGRTKKQAEAEVLESLEMIGLGAKAKRRVGSLSHGMVKRLGIAQAFLGHPEVILLDEPTAGLDPANARQIRDLIQRLQERATIVVSSHNLAEIQELCDHVAIMNHGQLVLAGTVDEITGADREFSLGLSRPLDAAELEQLKSLDGVHEIVESSTPGEADYTLRLNLTDDHLDQDGVIAAVLTCVLEMRVTPRRLVEGRNLEKHFLELTDDSDQTDGTS